MKQRERAINNTTNIQGFVEAAASLGGSQPIYYGTWVQTTRTKAHAGFPQQGNATVYLGHAQDGRNVVALSTVGAPLFDFDICQGAVVVGTYSVAGAWEVFDAYVRLL